MNADEIRRSWIDFEGIVVQFAMLCGSRKRNAYARKITGHTMTNRERYETGC